MTLGSVTSEDITIENNDCSFLRKLGTITSAQGAEIPAFDPLSNRIYVVSGISVEYFVVNAFRIPVYGGQINPGFTIPNNTSVYPNSISVKNGIMAVCYDVQNNMTLAHLNGRVAFYSSLTGAFIHSVNVGHLPDMITFSPDGTKVLTADEGEPNSYGQGNSFDAEGSVSIIDVSAGV